jgi:hypothetical protein
MDRQLEQSYVTDRASLIEFYLSEYTQKLYWKGLLHRSNGSEDLSQHDHDDVAEWLGVPSAGL